MSYPRRCPVSTDRHGQPCEAVLPSVVAFRRHLCRKHDCELVTHGRGPQATEEIRLLPPSVAERRRLMLSYRQGGRGDIRRRLAAAFDDNVQSSSRPTAVQYVPAGYRSHTPSSVSSLSSGGLTDDTEFDCSPPSWLDNLLPELSSLGTVQCLFQDAACDAMPPPATRHQGVQAGVTYRHTAVDARRLPEPWLAPPRLATRALAERLVLIMSASPSSTPEQLIASLLSTLEHRPSSAEQRTLDMSVQLAIELLRATAVRTLRDVAPAMAVDHSAALRAITDSMSDWVRRPTGDGLAVNILRVTL